jgi:hypothetical protein
MLNAFDHGHDKEFLGPSPRDLCPLRGQYPHQEVLSFPIEPCRHSDHTGR